MKELGYFMTKVKGKLLGNRKERMCDYFRKAGMKIGNNCNIVSNIMTTEPYLVEVGNKVTFSGGVTLLTHDNSISKVIPGSTDMFGKIKIGNNCFIGMNTTILYGVTLADNVIVASGSVVTKSFLEPNVIIGGNPARVIGTWDKFAEKCKDKALNIKGLSAQQKFELLSNENNLVSR